MPPGASTVTSASASASADAPVADGGSSSDAFAAGIAVALATMVHDVIMTPMDCIKQRLQLGHHRNSLVDCACAIVKQKGAGALMLSYPTTLLMSVPYALVMGTTNEALRDVLNPGGEHSLPTYMLVSAATCTPPLRLPPLLSPPLPVPARPSPPLPPLPAPSLPVSHLPSPSACSQSGAGAGMAAAAITNPLDVVKTRLQTQHLQFTCADVPPAAAPARGVAAPAFGKAAGRCAHSPLAYQGMVQTARTVLAEEGARGFSRGMQARMLIYAPSVAICWTTYESIKHLLVRTHLFE